MCSYPFVWENPFALFSPLEPWYPRHCLKTLHGFIQSSLYVAMVDLINIPLQPSVVTYQKYAIKSNFLHVILQYVSKNCQITPSWKWSRGSPQHNETKQKAQAALFYSWQKDLGGGLLLLISVLFLCIITVFYSQVEWKVVKIIAVWVIATSQ